MSAPARVVIVDDEELARERLRQLCQRHGHIDIVAECADGDQALVAIERERPDFVFLDICMPGQSGVDVANALVDDADAPGIVFVTAHDEFALRAFEVHAVDYLLKPIAAERLSEALTRVRERLDRGERVVSPGAMAAARPRDGHSNRVLVRDGPRVHVIPVDKIDYVQAQDDYVCFRSEGKDYLKHVGPQLYVIDKTNIGTFDQNSSLAPADFKPTFNVD